MEHHVYTPPSHPPHPHDRSDVGSLRPFPNTPPLDPSAPLRPFTSRRGRDGAAAAGSPGRVKPRDTSVDDDGDDPVSIRVGGKTLNTRSASSAMPDSRSKRPLEDAPPEMGGYVDSESETDDSVVSCSSIPTPAPPAASQALRVSLLHVPDNRVVSGPCLALAGLGCVGWGDNAVRINTLLFRAASPVSLNPIAPICAKASLFAPNCE